MAFIRKHEFHTERLDYGQKGWRYSVVNGGWGGAWGQGGPKFGSRRVTDGYAAALALAWGYREEVDAAFPRAMYWWGARQYSTRYIVWADQDWYRVTGNGGERGAHQFFSQEAPERISEQEALRLLRDEGFQEDVEAIKRTGNPALLIRETPAERASAAK